VTDTVAVALVSGTFSFLAAVLSFLNRRLVKQRIERLEETNGNMAEVLVIKQELRVAHEQAAFSRGQIEGRRLEREQRACPVEITTPCPLDK
jgi:hypothetical protein